MFSKCGEQPPPMSAAEIGGVLLSANAAGTVSAERAPPSGGNYERRLQDAEGRSGNH